MVSRGSGCPSHTTCSPGRSSALTNCLKGGGRSDRLFIAGSSLVLGAVRLPGYYLQSNLCQQTISGESLDCLAAVGETGFNNCWARSQCNRTQINVREIAVQKISRSPCPEWFQHCMSATGCVAHRLSAALSNPCTRRAGSLCRSAVTPCNL